MSFTTVVYDVNIYIYIYIYTYLDAPISQIYFVMELYMFRTVRLSIIRSLFTVHSAMVYVVQVCRQLSRRLRHLLRVSYGQRNSRRSKRKTRAWSTVNVPVSIFWPFDIWIIIKCRSVANVRMNRMVCYENMEGHI